MREKRTVIISSLAARFPVSGGWDLETLNKYLTSGSWREMDYAEITPKHPDTYYILGDPSSKYDTKKLIADFDILLLGADDWGELRGMTLEEILEERNW
jgi:hypothetical protein